MRRLLALAPAWAAVPVTPLPAGAWIDGDTLSGVLPGSPMRFQVQAENATVPQGDDAQVLPVTVRIATNGGLVWLDERELDVIVPCRSR